MGQTFKIDKSNVEEILSLSPMQEGMLFHYLKDLNSDQYFEQLSLRVLGKIDMVIFKRAWDFVTSKNEMLRTIFRWDKLDKPIQIILKKNNTKILKYDFCCNDISESIKKLYDVKIKDKNNKFDLREVPFRVTLCKLGENQYEMIITNHHILYDGWSTGIILQDFLYAYDTLDKNKNLEKIETFRVREFIKYLDEKSKKLEQLYWEKYLADFAGENLIQMQQEEASGRKLEQYNFNINDNFIKEIDLFTQDKKLTLAEIVYCAWGILLQKYTNSRDILFGTTVSGRNIRIKGIENAVGLFINTIPLRIESNENKSISQLLLEIKNLIRERELYETTALVDIKKYNEINGKKDLFDSLVVVENYPLDNLLNKKDSVLDIVSYSIEEQTNYPLTLSINRSEYLNFKLTYDKAFMSKEYIRNMSEHFINILKFIIKESEKNISEISILSEQEKTQVLYEFNDTNIDYPKDKTIYELFEAQVEKTPDNIAVVFEDKKLTYRELNERANSLARVLRDKGVKADSIVGIMAERSLEMIIGIMSILKAGGAYLPIDPIYPKERIQYMLKDSKSSILLTTKELLDNIEYDVECIDLLNIELFKGELDNLEKINNSNNLIYVIYTSGTTGNPKGTIVKHQSFTNLMQWYDSEFEISKKDNILLMASLSFDLAQKNIYAPLIVGGKLTLANKGIINYEKINKIIHENKITIINCAPSMFNPIMEFNKETNYVGLKSLKHVFLGGEPINLKKLNDWINSKDYSCEIVNTYGPTECTDIATFYRLEKEDTGSVPIGKPINNVKLYILDKDRNFVPVGVEGELYISGDGLSRGYVNREELTVEKFVNNPFEVGTKMYKTGDLAKWLPDGNIEFLGRIDNQVKIRGFRIELGEIENRLLQYENIKEAAVVVKENKDGEKYICAYVVSENSIEELSLKSYLKEILPEYMVPTYFVQLEKMPLTPNGKLDRRALPEPNLDTALTEYEAPRNEIEETLAKIWGEVLGVDKVGINDNFFDLGGHSLKATMLMSKIHKELNKEVPLKELFKSPTIKELSKYIASAEENLYSNIEKVGEKEYYEASSAQKRMYMLQQFNKDSTAYNMPAVFEIEGKVDKNKIKETFRKLTERHEALRTYFETLDGEIIQKLQNNYKFDLVCRSESTNIEEIINGFVGPFDLEKVPLFRVELVESKEKTYLLIDMHHIISDGVSMSILINEFTEIYGGKTLEPLKLQYKDFAAWQNNFLKSEDMKKQEEYWINRFSDEIPVLNMPTDYERPAMQSFEGESLSFEVDEDTTLKLRKLTKETGTTMHMALLSAFNILLSKYSGQEDVVIGTPIAGRPHADLQNIIGMFVNSLALRNKPEGDKKYIDFLKEVKENSLKAYENQSYQLEALVEKLDVRRDTSRNPLFDVMFNMIDTVPGGDIKLDDIISKQYNNENKISKFDLTLNALESDTKLNFTIEYCSKLFKKKTIERLSSHYVRILDRIVNNREIKLCEVDLLSEAERNQILYEFNDTKADYPKDKTIHELFEAQVEKTPDNIAVIFEDKKLTYRELNERANSLARVLRAKGVNADSIVGIMVERSLEMIVGIMGILKSGGAYLPIDPNYPKERIEYMLKDSESKMLLSSNTLIESIEFDGEAINLFNKNLFINDSTNLEKINNSSSLVYAIYTSGTTGKPKGAMIEHRSLVNRLNWMQKKYPISEKDTILQKTTYTFDVSVWEILWWSLVGAKVCMLSPNDEKDPMKIIETIDKYQVTTMHFVPSMLDVFLYCIEENRNNINLSSLKRVFSSGEALKFKQVLKFYKEFENGKKLINLYGPTEATIDVSYFECINDGRKVIPIGKPIDNTKLYILKNNGLVPIGVAGELYITGNGLARGYVNRPGLTTEKFVDSPFEVGTKMYKTGDIARWLSDGNIEFLGRIDNQVKIRGFRIELDEIENHLLQHEYINNAVVLLKEDNERNKYLVGYIETNKLHHEIINNKKRYILPNNIAILSLNHNETEFMYKEIFEEQNYIKNGIEIKDGDCIFDIGANIGIFSLFINQINRNLQVYAFEPIPDLFDLLKINTELYNKNIKVFNYGISDKNTEANFTFYPKASIMSGRYSDYRKEKEIYTKSLINQISTIDSKGNLYDNYEQIIEERLESVEVLCKLKTLSEIIKENDIKKINLLKIDVEKSELDVLSGIDECDWDKIEQIVLEVHDLNGQLSKIKSTLERRGYNIKISSENELKNTNIYNVYAMRRLNGFKDNRVIESRPIPILNNMVLTKNKIKEFLNKSLPEYMIPAYFVQLEKMPLTPNGKLDRRALPEPNVYAALTEYEAPRNAVEETLAKIWSEVLGIEKVGINDNFFDLGGHSLKATMLMSKIHKELNKEIPLKELFKSPTIKELTKYIESAEENLYSKIEKVGEKEYYETSSAQRRMYMLQQFDKNSVAYNMPVVFELEGKVDKNKIEETFRKLTERHDAVRTYFETIDGGIIQKLQNNHGFKLVNRNGSGNIEDIINDFVRPFDLEKAPLIRVELVESKEKTYLLIDMHHIISDGISMSLLVKEFTEIYSGRNLKSLKLQYKDFVAWQNNFLKSEEIKKQEEYWINRFSDEIPVLNIPTDYERPAIQSFEGDSVSFDVDEETTLKLRTLTKETGTTMHMVLLSAFNILLSKYSGQEDIVIGTPIAGRPHDNLQNIMGMFVNSLALRNKPEGDKKYIDFLKEVKENSLNAYENQSYQLEALVEKLDVRRDTSRNPLFDVMFNMVDTITSDDIKLDDIILKQYNNKSKISKFDLVLNAIESDTKLNFTIEYCSKLFKKETIERLGRHYVRILDSIVNNKEIKLGEVGLLSEAEKNQILYDFNDTKVDYPKDKTIHELFEAQVEKTPDNIAVVFEDRKLTYRELNERANSLARILRAKGVKADSIVGIMVERSLEMIVGIMGILKAGGAYLPIDPNYPKERIEYMLKDSESKILLSSNTLIEFIEFDGEAIDLFNEKLFTSKLNNLDKINNSTNLVYVIYTSGTTGNPKGVMIEHRSLVAYINSFLNEFKLNEKDVVLQQATYCFDGFVDEVYPILLVGGRFVICNKYDALDISRLENIVTKNNISVVSCSPLFLNELNKSKNLTSIHTFISGGDILKLGYYNNLTYARVYNTYGPTETTVCASYYRCENKDTNNIPIGRPIGNYRMYILDKYKNLAPIDIAGELYICGEGVARGYLNRQDLSAEKFVDNPFEEQTKMYKTGDLARWLPDGNIEFLGRIDNQVKIRGFRIELGEIENKLLQHEAIEDVTVVVKANTDIGELCAFIITKYNIMIEDLRKYISEKLPEYMIPTRFVKLDKMPLTSNGKIDKKLLANKIYSYEDDSIYAEPSDDFETKIFDISCKTLGIDRISVEENLFSIGLDSFKSIQLISNINKTFDINLTINILFEHNTIRKISNYIYNYEENKKNINSISLIFNKEGNKKIFTFPPVVGQGIAYKGMAEFLEGYTTIAFNFVRNKNRIMQYADTIEKLSSERDIIMLAHSAGGLLAYDVAIELVKRGKRVTDIIFMDVVPGDGVCQTDEIILEEIDRKIGNKYKLLNEYLSESYSKGELRLDCLEYTKYCNSHKFDKQIDTKIHFISSESVNSGLTLKICKETYSKLTGNEVSIYQGYGKHKKMLDPEFALKNSYIVKSILNIIEENKTK